MEGLLSTAIGLQGAPKDYSSVVLARERQKGVEQQAKKAKKDKLFEDVYKKTLVDNNKYFDFRVPQVKERFATFLEELEKATEAEDLGAAYESQNNFKRDVGIFANEYTEGDRTLQGIRKGELIGDVDLESFNKGDFGSFSQSPGESVIFDKDNPIQPISIKVAKRIDIPKRYMALAGKHRDTDFELSDKNVMMPDGTIRQQIIYKNDPERLRSLLENDFYGDPNIKDNMFYRMREEDREAYQNMTPNERLSQAKESYVQEGFNFFGQKDKFFGTRKPDVTNVNLNTGSQQNVPTPLQFRPTEINEAKGIEGLGFAENFSKEFGNNVRIAFSQNNYPVEIEQATVAPFKVNTQSGKKMVDIYTGKELSQAEVVDQTYSNIMLVPVYDEPKNKERKQIPIPKSIMDNPVELEKLNKTGRVTYIGVALGSNGIRVPFDDIVGASYMAESDKDKSLIDAVYKNTQERIKQKNKEMGLKPSQRKTEAPFAPKQTQQQQQQTGGSGGASVPSNYSKYKRQ